MNVKPVITFALGVVTGAGAMFLGMKRYFEKKKDKEVAKERRYFHERLRAMASEDEDDEERPNTPEKPVDRPEAPVEEYNTQVPTYINRPVYPVDNPETQEIFTAYRDILERAHYGEDVDIDEMIEEARKAEPQVIDMGEYGQGEFECIGLTYLLDNILVDETTGQRIPDEEINELIGQDAVSELVEGEDYVYVRNPALRVDIEITYDRTRNYAEFCEDQPTMTG